jgi:Raf kinase inhibitor-like protein, YbhB/YbcL family
MRKPVFLIIIGILGGVAIFTVTAIFLFRPTRSEVFSNSIEMPPTEAGFALISPDFSDGGPIPEKYTCYGENVPPTLAWGQPPARTKSYFLVMKDPDAAAGPWIHWIVYNLPVETHSVNSLTRPIMQIDGVTILFGKNSWGKQTYGGPCPPSGTHHYVFLINALSIDLGPKNNGTFNELTAQMQGSILGTAELIGTYTK